MQWFDARIVKDIVHIKIYQNRDIIKSKISRAAVPIKAPKKLTPSNVTPPAPAGARRCTPAEASGATLYPFIRRYKNDSCFVFQLKSSSFTFNQIHFFQPFFRV